MEQARIDAAAQAVLTVAAIVKEAGSIPSGHLYAHLMAVGITLEQYQAILQIMKRTGLVTEQAHLLTWKGGN